VHFGISYTLHVQKDECKMYDTILKIRFSLQVLSDNELRKHLFRFF